MTSHRAARSAAVPPRRPTWLTVATAAVIALAGCSSGSTGSLPTAPTQLSAEAADQPIELVLGLQRDQPELVNFANDVNTPANPAFGEFLSLADVGEKFGATQQAIETAVTYLNEQGVTKVFTDPAGGYVRITLTVAQAQELFGGDWHIVDQSGVTVSRPQGTPQIPPPLQGSVTEIVGEVQVVKRPAKQDSSIEGQVDDATGCRQSRQRRNEIRQRYGIDRLQRDGYRGKGLVVAIPTIQDSDAVSLGRWRQCFRGTLPNVQTAHVGGPVTGDRHDEIALDVTAVHSVLPDLTQIRITQFDEFDWVGDAFAQSLTAKPRLPDAIVSSVVYCAASVQPAAIQLTEYVLATAAAAGVTVVAAAGDTGSSGCYPPESAEASTYPAASPFVTAVGGSTFVPDTRNAPPTTDEVWRDGSELAGGGASAAEFEAPFYQPSGRRTVPDVSLVADPDLTPPIPQCTSAQTCGWGDFGGTSYSAPVVAASLMSVKQWLAARDVVAPASFNPSLYALMASGAGGGRSPVTDIVTGDNDLFGVGCCIAGVGYDRASGWGAPDFAALAEGLRRTLGGRSAG